MSESKTINKTEGENKFWATYGHLINANNCADWEDWPEDEWESVSDDYDLNVWKDIEGHCHATIYNVVDGETDTSCWVTIFTTLN